MRNLASGKVLTYDDVKLRNDPKEEILLSNMRYDPIVCQTANGFSHTAHFNERDVVVDAAGKIVERGDTPERIAYRKQNRSALS